jgi:hypothetical protein
MTDGVRRGESLIWDYGPDVLVERAFSVELDRNGRAYTNEDGSPAYLWRCYERCGALDWDEERGVGKHPLNGHETSSNEFWIEIGKGSAEEMDELAQQRAAKLKGA